MPPDLGAIKRSLFTVLAVALAFVRSWILPPKSDEGAGSGLVLIGVLAITYFIDLFLFRGPEAEQSRGFKIDPLKDKKNSKT